MHNPSSVPYADLIKDKMPDWVAIPGQEGHPEEAGSYSAPNPNAEPDYPGARAGDSGMHSGVMYGDESHNSAEVDAKPHDPGLDVEYFDPNLHYSADNIIEEDDDPGDESIWGDDISWMLPFLEDDPLGMGGDYPLEDRPPYMFFNTGNNDKENQAKAYIDSSTMTFYSSPEELQNVTKTKEYGEGEEAEEEGEEEEETGEAGGGGGSYTEINNFYDYDYNYDYQYYFFDVGLQFTPRVGSVFSINTNPYMLYVGSAAQASDSVGIGYNNGTAWKPSKQDLPDIIGSLGLTYRYAALYDGYWGTSTYDLSEDVAPGLPGMASTKLDSTVDAASTTFERSWQNRHPGNVVNEKEELEDFFADRGNGSLTETDLTGGEPSWMTSNQLSGFVAEQWKEADLSPSTQKDTDTIKSMYTGHNFYEWYREEDITPSTQNLYNSSVITSLGADVLPDKVLRAIEILGEDILLRDEWVASDAYPTKIEMYNYNTGESLGARHFDMYYYIYSNTSVFDEALGGPKSLLTQDYIIQSIYRALGVNCVRSQVYLYSDKYYTINNTPLATQLTVALDKVNQIQNRMDVFVTRANLDKYWEKAITDGLVQNSGRLMYNELDAMYKPYSAKVASGVLPDPNSKSTADKVTLAGADTYVEVKAGAKKAGKDTGITYDSAREQKLTLAEFCVLVRRAMDIYGEEVLTEREQDMLLVYYGTRLPYELEDKEQFEAIKYLMAKGIVESQLAWTDPLTINDMLVILSRVKDEGSRLTYKEIDLVYDESLLDQGYYPATISSNVGDGVEIANVTMTSSYNYENVEWFDYFLRLTDEDVSDVNVKSTMKIDPTTYYTADSGTNKSFEKVLLLKNPGKGFRDVTTGSGSKSTIYVNELEGAYDPSLCKYVETIRLDDGYYYLHVCVNAKVLLEDIETSADKWTTRKYISKGNHVFLTIGDRSAGDSLRCYALDWRGGIYRNPVAEAIDASNEDGTKTYWVKYDNKEYYSGYNSWASSSSVKDYKPSKPSISIDDTEAIKKARILPSSITKVTMGGYIEEAKYYTKKYVNDKSDSAYFMSFDDAGFGVSYCDYSRYKLKYARCLLQDPYLAEDAKPNSIGSIVPKYDIWFYLVGNGGEAGDTLTDSYCWGDASDDNVVIKAEDPTHPIPDKGASIEFVKKVGSKYYYVVRGQCNEYDVASKLHALGDGSLAAASYFSGYIKENNTVLIDVNNITKLVNEGYCYGSSITTYTNFTATKVKPNLLLISAEDSSDTTASTLLNIYLYDDLKLCIVNNMVYEVPGNEILYVEQIGDTGDAQDVTYLINWRAVLGWNSGYKITSVDADGSVHIGVGCTDTDHSYSNKHIVNAWTGIENNISVLEYGDHLVLPMTSPYVHSNWFVFASDRKGTYAFVIKNNDTGAEDSVIDELKEDKKANDLYKNGSLLMRTLLGVEVSSGGDTWFDESYVIACYNLGVAGSDYLTTSDRVISDSALGQNGKFFYDKTTDGAGTWCYVIPTWEITGNMGLGRIYATAEQYAEFPGVYRKTDNSIVFSTEYTYYTKKLKAGHEGYYNGKYALPIFCTGKITGDVIDISCNVYSGLLYGAVPAHTYYPFSVTRPPNYEVKVNHKLEDIYLPGYDSGGMKRRGFANAWMRDQFIYVGYTPLSLYKAVAGNKLLSSMTGEEAMKLYEEESQFFDVGASPTTIAPAGIIYFIVGDLVYSAKEALSAGKEDSYGVKVLQGNYEYRGYINADGICTIAPMSQLTVGATSLADETPLTLVCMSGSTAYYSYNSVKFSYSEERDGLVEDTIRNSLLEIEQPKGVDWQEFTFDRLVHNIDNAFSIILIIALNVIPRVGMFVFIILIGLSVIADIPIWRKFCANVFDPYKLMTFGHADVLTINTKLLLVSSMIGLAVFAMFMDGTIIHLLAWIVQFCSGWIIR